MTKSKTETKSESENSNSNEPNDPKEAVSSNGAVDRPVPVGVKARRKRIAEELTGREHFLGHGDESLADPERLARHIAGEIDEDLTRTFAACLQAMEGDNPAGPFVRLMSDPKHPIGSGYLEDANRRLNAGSAA